jgi:putative transposase
MVLRWTAAGVLEAERGFRKLAGYRAIPTLVAALRAHDAQLDHAEGKLDTKQDAA